MSDNIPFIIQREIMKRLPVKSLIQYRCVSKTWKSLIDSSDFITHYGVRHAEVQRLVFGYGNFVNNMNNYVSLVDDYSFPQEKVSVAIPPLVQRLKSSKIIGSSHGLFCLYGVSAGLTGVAVIWNVSIRKAVAVVVPKPPTCGIYLTRIGFGVCRETGDPKIVKVKYIEYQRDIENVACIPRQVEVFTLSTGAWKSLSGNLPRKSIYFGGCPAAKDGTLYWVANDGNTARSRYLIIPFDLTTEEFREVNLPDSLAYQSFLSLSKLKDSLVVIELNEEANNSFFGVWMMEDESFTKLFNIDLNTPNASKVIGFRKCGEAIIIVPKVGYFGHGQLAVYEPDSKRVYDIGIDGLMFSFTVNRYMETLLLHDQPNFIVYDDVEALNFDESNLDN